MPAEDRIVSEITFHVRYAETDSMGLVHHTAYLVWFEEGRSAFIRDRGWSYADIEASGYFLAATDLEASFLQAARYDQKVTVRTWIVETRSRAITFACEIIDASSDKLLFVASLKLICLDSAGKPARIPSSWKAWLDE